MLNHLKLFLSLYKPLLYGSPLDNEQSPANLLVPARTSNPFRESMGWLFKRKTARAEQSVRDAPLGAIARGSTLAGVGMVLRCTDGTVLVRKLVEGSAAESAGIRPGDCVVEVDGVKLAGNLSAATRAILGPIGSIARIKLVRIDGLKRLKILVLVLRELRATAEPEYKLEGDSKSCTTQYLHLECLQHTTEVGQHKDGAPAQTTAAGTADLLAAASRSPEAGAEDKVVRTIMFKGQLYSESEIRTLEQGIRKQMSDAEAKPGDQGAFNQHDPVERTVADNEAVDIVLQGCEMKLRKEEGKWTRVCARAYQGGRLLLRTPVMGKNIDLSANCMWCGVSSSRYTPKMSAKEFDEMNRKFYVMLEDGHMLAHASEGAVLATQGTKIELLADSEEQRDAWVKGITILVASGGDFKPYSPALSSAAPDGTVVRRVPLLPQLRRKQPPQSHPCETTAALPRVAAQARKAAAAALHMDDVSLPVEQEEALMREAAAREDETGTLRVKAQEAFDAARTADTSQSKTVESEKCDLASDDGTHMDAEVTEEGEIKEDSGEGDDRLAGLAMSRIACFEAAAQPKELAHAHAQPSLEAQWHKTATKFSVVTKFDEPVSLVKNVVDETSPATVQKMTGGGHLTGILAARRRAQEQREDDGYYF